MILEALYARALKLRERYDIDQFFTEEDTIVPFADVRAGIVEHVCHELGHALLLGVARGPDLPKRIGKAIYALAAVDPDAEIEPRSHLCDVNEIETFAVVMCVFDDLGIRYGMGDMIDAVKMQVGGGPRRIRRAWRAFRNTDVCAAAVAEILSELLSPEE